MKKKLYTAIALFLCLCLIIPINQQVNSKNKFTNMVSSFLLGKTSATQEAKAADTTATPSAIHINTSNEVKAVWVSFLEYGYGSYSKSQYENYINKTFSDCKSKGFNTIYMHVRPFADATYPSKYFPWSRFISGTAGKNPGYDPLAYAVQTAHKNGLSIHAWINPYRVSTSTTNAKTLPANSIARKWKTSKTASVRRRVLTFGSGLYFNPASSAVRTLIQNGVEEIVKNYDVDGIHFDDYFYPSLGSKYKKNFDYKEYNSYVKAQKKKEESYKSIVAWRRSNVSTLVKSVYKTVKSVDKECQFGISPAGNIDNLYSKDSYYVDIKKWMDSSSYIDYVCPQIYWSYTQKYAPYKTVLNRWASISRSSTVRLYIGLAGYRAGISSKEAKALNDSGWSKHSNILQKQVADARKTGKVSGFSIFSYNDLNRKSASKEMKNLFKELKKIK